MTAYDKGHIITTTSTILLSITISLSMLFQHDSSKKLKVGKQHKSITTKQLQN